MDYITFGVAELDVPEKGYIIKPQTDVYGRNTGKEITKGGKKITGEYIYYRKEGDHGTNMPSAVWYASGETIGEQVSYKYDKSGNIAEIRENGGLAVKYTYDAMNRIVREDNKKLFVKNDDTKVSFFCFSQ